MPEQDVKHFVALSKELRQMRTNLNGIDGGLNELQRDFVALAQAEALCDLAATLNDGIAVTSE